jgi:Protein of unknown function (DUF1579)
MDLPKAGPTHARLLALAGEWEGMESVEPSVWGKGGPATGRTSFRGDLDGFAVIQDYVQLKDSLVTFRGHGVFTVDPQTQEVLWYWFDSMGFPPDVPARGRFEGNALTLLRVTPRGSARYVHEISANEYKFSIENQFPGDEDFKLFMRASYTRKD